MDGGREVRVVADEEDVLPVGGDLFRVERATREPRLGHRLEAKRLAGTASGLDRSHLG